MKKMYSALILAGGSGQRLWPLSNEESPKQFLKLDSSLSLIAQTVERLKTLIPYESIYVSTNIEQFQIVVNEVPRIPLENIIVEPLMKDTAAAILYGSTYISEKRPDSLILVLSSDHLIKNEEEFLKALKIAFDECENNNSFITFGIVPEYPEINYGYIKIEPEWQINRVTEVQSFKEKPDITLARDYLESGEYLWNSGMFVFSTKLIFELYKNKLGKHYESIMRMKECISLGNVGRELAVEIKPYFKLLEKISFDYGIIEKLDEIKVIPIDIGWSDIGSYEEICKLYQDNKNENTVIDTKLKSLNSHDNLIITDEFEVGIIDIENLVIIQKGKRLLVCKMDAVDRIKELLDQEEEGANGDY